MSPILLATLLLAQADAPPPAAKARELLDASIESLSTATPPIQFAASVEIIKLYPEFDRKKTLELLDQALALPEADEALVVAVAAEIDAGKAIELLQAVPIDQRSFAVTSIVRALVSTRSIDRAVEVLHQNPGSSAGYPYSAAEQLLKTLPPDDPRRVTIFAAAAAAFNPKRSPYGFTRLLATNWRTLPRPAVQSAVTAIVNGILERDDSRYNQTTSFTSSKGSVHFDERKDAELFDLICILREFAPDQVKDLLEKRPNLAAAIKQFPEGRNSMLATPEEQIYTWNHGRIRGERDLDGEARMKAQAALESHIRQALALAGDDPSLALSRLKDVPECPARAKAIIDVARIAAANDPASAKPVIAQASSELASVKDPFESAPLWASLAEAAHKAGDDDTARKAIERGLDVCAQLYKLDSNADEPNTAPRDQWPSLQHYRTVVHQAARIDGANAEAILPSITDPDLLLMARIELARALLGKPREGANISRNYRRR